MVLADARRGLLERRAFLALQLRARLSKLTGGDLQIGDARGLDAIEAFRVVEHRRVAPHTHVPANRRYRPLHFLVEAGVERDELRQPLAEIGLSRRKTGDLRHELPQPSGASRAGAGCRGPSSLAAPGGT